MTQESLQAVTSHGNKTPLAQFTTLQFVFWQSFSCCSAAWSPSTASGWLMGQSVNPALLFFWVKVEDLPLFSPLTVLVVVSWSNIPAFSLSFSRGSIFKFLVIYSWPRKHLILLEYLCIIMEMTSMCCRYMLSSASCTTLPHSILSLCCLQFCISINGHLGLEVI